MSLCRVISAVFSSEVVEAMSHSERLCLLGIDRSIGEREREEEEEEEEEAVVEV